VVRTSLGQKEPKLRELVHADFYDWSAVEAQLTGWDACFFCLGVSSAGMSEADYRHVTYDLTLAAATVLARRNPGMTFVYVSGTGTDSSEAGRSMWARVKGQTENALLKLPFKATYLFRPGYIQPVHGVTSKTPLYRAGYAAVGWMYPLFKRLLPNQVTTSEQVGRAMLAVARAGAPATILENRDINAVSQRG
jgi:uncharacterized protein YbjT (DUF2867 family)